MQDYQKQALLYQQLISQGVPAKDAFAQAFPNGIPTALDRAKEAAKANQQAGVGQLGGTLVGALGTKAIYDAVTGKPILGGIFDSATAATDTASTAASAANTAASAPEIISASKIPVGADVASNAGSFWTTAPENYSTGQIVSGLGALYGGYNAIDDMGHGGSGRTGLTQAGASIGNIFGGPVGGAIGAGFGNIMGYGLQGDGIKNKIALALTAPPLLVAKLLGFDPVHKTTKQHQQEHNQQLLNLGSNNSAWQNYLKGARQGFGTTGPADPSKPFGDSKGNKYATWNDYVKGGLDAANLAGVYGNLKTFGTDWANLSEAQRQAVTQGVIDAGLYYSKKGEVEISDANKAMEIYKKIIPQVNKPTVAAPAPVESERLQRERLKQNGQFGNKLVGALS